MRLQSPIFAAVVAAGLFLFPSASFAEPHAPFGCETRYFDPSRNSSPGMVACYRPNAIRAAYGLDRLIKAGFDGAGQTIVILAPFGSPTALDDLKTFDEAFGLPDPPSFVQRYMGVPHFDETDSSFQWAIRVSADVQWAHAIAPRANIVLVAAASSDDADLLAGFNYAINNRLGNVVSMSFGQSEAIYANPSGRRIVARWERAFSRARAANITLFAPAGDYGSTNLSDDTGNAVFPFRNVSYPASSPQVTGVGGTTLFFGKVDRADPDGTYLGEKVWNDQPGINGAGGGGISALFGRPGYQDDLASSLGNRRGVPDVAYNAGRVGGVLVYLGFGINNFAISQGTSGGAAQWAGVIADINTALGRPIGFLNQRLYKQGLIGRRERDEDERGERHGRNNGRASLFHDVTVGNNCFNMAGDEESACVPGRSVPGFSATPGWDLATGWGTPNLGALATLLDQRDDDHEADQNHDGNHNDDGDHNHDGDHNRPN